MAVVPPTQDGGDNNNTVRAFEACTSGHGRHKPLRTPITACDPYICARVWRPIADRDGASKGAIAIQYVILIDTGPIRPLERGTNDFAVCMFKGMLGMTGGRGVAALLRAFTTAISTTFTPG